MDEKKYIELEAALKANCYFCSAHLGDDSPCVEKCADYTKFIEIPAADVQPRVKAFWIDVWSELDPNTSSSAECSNCHRISERPVGLFCKWCGADMSAEEG